MIHSVLVTNRLMQARGEGEAELAALSFCKLIDLVITEDSDALIFGTRMLGRGQV